MHNFNVYDAWLYLAMGPGGEFTEWAEYTIAVHQSRRRWKRIYQSIRIINNYGVYPWEHLDHIKRMENRGMK